MIHTFCLLFIECTQRIMRQSEFFDKSNYENVKKLSIRLLIKSFDIRNINLMLTVCKPLCGKLLIHTIMALGSIVYITPGNNSN